MSFEIILTRSIIPGTGRRLENAGPPLKQSDFELIMDGAPIRRRLEDGAVWLWHPHGLPWLSASFRTDEKSGEGYIAFSLSYAHTQFLKVLADAFELSLRLARHISARVFEESYWQELTQDNAEIFLLPHGKFVSQQAAFWKQTVAGLEERLQAPLEYPIGRYDAVNDYFLFFLEPEPGKIDLREVQRKLGLCVAPDSLASDRFALQDAETGSILSRVLLRPNDGALQIHPFYWMEPFAKVANETLSLSTKLQRLLGGRLLLRDKPLTASLNDEITANISGLGVEFFLWQQGLST